MTSSAPRIKPAADGVALDRSQATVTDVERSKASSASSRDADLSHNYSQIRNATLALCEPLDTEDFLLQSMPDASPVKWHLAHSTWFFETFVLAQYRPNHREFHPQYKELFNSYYNSVGVRWPRPRRGLLSHPTTEEICRYRAAVDEQVLELLATSSDPSLRATVLLGIHHEQQHQELILTDLKHAWADNPLGLIYRPALLDRGPRPPRDWRAFPEGIEWIGHEGCEFSFDNESPRHRVFLHDFQLATRLVTNAEYLEFIGDEGYARPELWLSDGWATVQSQNWRAPLYWHNIDGAWTHATLNGPRTVLGDEPVCHVSYYEADAFARWAGVRLPTEFEWEVAAAEASVVGHFAEGKYFHPAASCAADDHGPLFKLFGDVWQWTASAYLGYPGYRPVPGALGEYNGKFMCNQFVLRGASCATPRSHARRTYRNFFSPEARWQFSGIRLAKDLA